jgi:hypothetical protein
MIENYNKEYGNMFYIPKGVKEYLQENGAGKEWKKILNEINRKHIYMRMEIYYERCKEHSKVMNIKKLKKEWVEGKRIKIIEDPLDHIPKKIKYNEKIDLTKEISEIIVYLTVKRKRNKSKKNKAKNNEKRKEYKKKKKKLVITEPIPK